MDDSVRGYTPVRRRATPTQTNVCLYFSVPSHSTQSQSHTTCHSRRMQITQCQHNPKSKPFLDCVDTPKTVAWKTWTLIFSSHHKCQNRRVEDVDVNLLLTPGGKTVAWKTLVDAKGLLKNDKHEGFEKVQPMILNPKSVTMDELRPWSVTMDLATMEWKDGVLSALIPVASTRTTPRLCVHAVRVRVDTDVILSRTCYVRKQMSPHRFSR